MAYSWDDEHFEVVNPDLSLLMSDCPVELSIQSHGLMLNVRRSVQLPYAREDTAWRRTPVPITRDLKVLRRVQSFQDPAVSSSSGGSYPILKRVSSFFDFSRENAQVLDFNASDVLPQSEKVCRGGDGGVGEGENLHKTEEEKVGSNETPPASDVKNEKSSPDAEAHVDSGGKKAVDHASDKPILGSTGGAKVDVSETIRKIESALEDALNVGSLKIDVRERIKRIQSAFEGFIPWDSAVGRPKVELGDPKPIDKVAVEELPKTPGVVKVKTPEIPDDTQIERENNTKEMKQGELDDSGVGDVVQACTCDDSLVEQINQEQIFQDLKDSRPDEVSEVHVDTPTAHSQNDGAAEVERIIEGVEDGGQCPLSNVREVAEVVPESDASSEDETLDTEMDDTGLSALDSMDEMDEMQAEILDFEALNPIVEVRDPYTELKANNDIREEEAEECDRVRVDNPEMQAVVLNSEALNPIAVVRDPLSELRVDSDMREEEPEECDRAQADSPCNAAAAKPISEMQALVLDLETLNPISIVRDPLSELKVNNDVREEECDIAKQVQADSPCISLHPIVVRDPVSELKVNNDLGEEPEECDKVQVDSPCNSLNPIVVVGEPKHANDMREEEAEECDRVQADSPCNTAASRPVSVQSDELKQESGVKDVKEETPEYSDRSIILESSEHTATVANVESDASSGLNQILEEIRSRQTSRLKLIAGVDDGDVSWDTPTRTSQSDNLVREISLSMNEVDEISMLWNGASVETPFKQDRAVNDSGLRTPNIKAGGEVQLEAGEELVLSEKDATDTSDLPSPLSKLLDYRRGSAFTFLNVQDEFPEPSSSVTVERSAEKKFARELCEALARKPRKAEAQIAHAVNRLSVQETPHDEDVQMFGERDTIQLWSRVLQEVTSRNLKHLLLTQGRLVSAGVSSDGSSAIVEVEFRYATDKHKAERSWRSICSAFRSVLAMPIELRISLMKNVFDEPCNLEGMDDAERHLLIQHTSRLTQETEVACYSTDSHIGPNSKRRRRRARRDWNPAAQELEPQPRSETGSAPGPTHRRKHSVPTLIRDWRIDSSFSESVAMQPTHRRKGSVEDWRTNGLESSFNSESVAGSTEMAPASMPAIEGRGRRPRLRTMLDAEKSDTDDNHDSQSNAAMQKIAEFRTDRGLPLDVFCFPCQRIPQLRREPSTRDTEQFGSGRERDLRSKQMDGRVSMQATQPFFLRMVPCKSVTTVRASSKAHPPQ